jgi:uncharacterized protein
MTTPRIRFFLPSLLLAAGIAAAGHFVGEGIADRQNGKRTISVKGLSEKEVAASIAIWNIGFHATGNELTELSRKLGDSTKAVVIFLKQAGFDEQEVAIQPPGVSDMHMEVRGNDTPPPPERFSAQQSVLLRTSKVDLVKPALASVSSLMMAGVLISGYSQPSYIFNQLNEIKPGMIREATHAVRIPGLVGHPFRFYSDSHSDRIRTAVPIHIGQ